MENVDVDAASDAIRDLQLEVTNRIEEIREKLKFMEDTDELEQQVEQLQDVLSRLGNVKEDRLVEAYRLIQQVLDEMDEKLVDNNKDELEYELDELENLERDLEDIESKLNRYL